MKLRWRAWSPRPKQREWIALACVWGFHPITVTTRAMDRDFAILQLKLRAAEVMLTVADSVFLENVGSCPLLPEGGRN